jgi:hypothetical protein
VTVKSYSSESLLVQYAIYIILWVAYAGVCRAEFLCLRGLFLLDVSMLVNKLWGNKPPATELLRDGKHKYIAVLPGAFRGSFTTLHSPPQCTSKHSTWHLGLGGSLTLLSIYRCYPHLQWGHWRLVSGRVNNVYMGWYVSLGYNCTRWIPARLWSQRPYQNVSYIIWLQCLDSQKLTIKGIMEMIWNGVINTLPDNLTSWNYISFTMFYA